MNELKHNGDPITDRDREMLVAGAHAMACAIDDSRGFPSGHGSRMWKLVCCTVFGIRRSRVESLLEQSYRHSLTTIMGTVRSRTREKVPAVIGSVMDKMGLGDLKSIMFRGPAKVGPRPAKVRPVKPEDERVRIPAMTEEDIERLWKQHGGGDA